MNIQRSTDATMTFRSPRPNDVRILAKSAVINVGTDFHTGMQRSQMGADRTEGFSLSPRLAAIVQFNDFRKEPSWHKI